MNQEPESDLLLRPDPVSWPALARGHFQRINDRHRTVRAQLGLPPDRPVVMAGHQAVFWHPGILAKVLAADAVAGAVHGSAAWISVDQDSGDPFSIRYPARSAQGRLTVATTHVLPVSRPAPVVDDATASAPTPAGIPVAYQNPCLIEWESQPAADSVRDGLTAIAESLRAHTGERSAARQVAAALNDLLAPLAAPRACVFVTSLAGTDLFGELLERMRTGPLACVRAYDAAVARHPEAGLRRLLFDETNDRFELPLWRLEPGRPRRSVFAEDLPNIPGEQLAPKALLMTALVRAAACDVFIHGLGGELYDRATQEWLSAWAPDLTLSPGAVATATLTLPLTERPPTAGEVARARWLAHRARHDPAVLDDPRGAAQKRELAVAIAQRPRHSAERADLYHRMHEALATFRDAHTSELARFSAEAALLAEKAADAEIAGDRTWAFPLYPREVLLDLRDRIHRAIAG